MEMRMKKKNIILHIVSFCILCVGFVLCRFVFVDFHGMYQWSKILFYFGLLVIVASFFFKGKITPLCTSFAYLVGFAWGAILQTDGVDPGGGRTNNLWIIWTVVFICIVIISVLTELIINIKQKIKHKSDKELKN